MDWYGDGKLTAIEFQLSFGDLKSKRRVPMRAWRTVIRQISRHRPKYFALRSVKLFHFSGRSSSAKIADTGHTGTQAPQSMHSTGSMYSISSSACAGSSFLGWMQSTGQASTQAVSFVPMHGSAITYAMGGFLPNWCGTIKTG